MGVVRKGQLEKDGDMYSRKPKNISAEQLKTATTEHQKKKNQRRILTMKTAGNERR